MDRKEVKTLAITAAKARLLAVEAVHRCASGHPGGSLSVLDVLTVLYFHTMRVDPQNPADPDRDRFVLSKGHCTPALYATLALRGYYAVEELELFRSIKGHMSGHPDMVNVKGVDMSTGSLGQGISAAVGMDKAVFKEVLKSAGLPVLGCVTFRSREYMTDKAAVTAEITEKIGFPLIIKPVNLGSSVGITKVNSADELDSAITLAASFTDRILAEHAITNLREINCSVLGDADECTASVCEEPFMHDEILSYEDKYMSGSKGGSKGMASLGRKIPADLSEDKSEEIRKLACDVFKAINASGVVRIDFMIDCDTDKVYANEINTIPGSLAFYLWEATGLKYTDMIDRLAEVAFRRQRERENLTFTIDTNILSGVSFGAKGAKGAKL